MALVRMDDWAPTAGASALSARAELLGRMRAYFAAAGVLEVETPILSACAPTDPAIESLSLVEALPGEPGDARRRLYLQTSPEFHMKRLLAAGSGPIYQICKVFRGGERGRLHHLEFTLLEWYRPGWDYGRLMDEVADLVRVALGRPTLPVERVRYRDLFLDGLGLDPWAASLDELRQVAIRSEIPDAESLELDHDGWLDLLLTQCLQARLGCDRLSFLCDYPPSQAALARIRPAAADQPAVAERFELYLAGIELANGFQELTDATEQAARFVTDLAERRARGQPEPRPDHRLLAALAAGMPTTSGVALGLDRLLMLAIGAHHLDQVIAFPIERA